MICIVAVSVRVSRLRVCVNREGWAECMSVIKGPDENSWSSLRVSPGHTGRSASVHIFIGGASRTTGDWSLTWSLSVSLGVETRTPCSVFPVSGLGLASEAHRVVLRGFDDTCIVFNPVFNIPPASALLSRRQHYVPSIWYLFFHPTTGGGGSVSPITILRKKDKTDLTRVDRGGCGAVR